MPHNAENHVGTPILTKCSRCGNYFGRIVKIGPPPRICPGCKTLRVPAKPKAAKVPVSKPENAVVCGDGSILTRLGDKASTMPGYTVPQPSIDVESDHADRHAFPVKLHVNKSRTRIIADCSHQMKYAETEIEILDPNGDVMKRIQIAVNPLGWTMKVLSHGG